MISLKEALKLDNNGVAELRKELKEKINILNKIKDEVYLGNKDIILNVIKKGKEGIL